MRIHSQRKKPASAMPSTIIIMPAMNMMVSQLMPVLAAACAPAEYQKCVETMLCKFKVSLTASKLCIPTPNTSTQVKRPAISVTICRCILSITMKMNIAINIISAVICANMVS